MPAASPTPYNDSIGYDEPVTPYNGMVAPVTTTSSAIDTGDLAAALATGVVTGTPGALDTLVAHLLPDTAAAADDSTTTVAISANGTTHTLPSTGALTAAISGTPTTSTSTSVPSANTLGSPLAANTSHSLASTTESTVATIDPGTLSAAPSTGATTADVE